MRLYQRDEKGRFISKKHLLLSIVLGVFFVVVAIYIINYNTTEFIHDTAIDTRDGAQKIMDNGADVIRLLKQARVTRADLLLEVGKVTEIITGLESSLEDIKWQMDTFSQ